jgi:hypothetical protein
MTSACESRGTNFCTIAKHSVKEVLLLKCQALGAKFFENSITHVEERLKSFGVLRTSVEKLFCHKTFYEVRRN